MLRFAGILVALPAPALALSFSCNPLPFDGVAVYDDTVVAASKGITNSVIQAHHYALNIAGMRKSMLNRRVPPGTFWNDEDRKFVARVRAAAIEGSGIGSMPDLPPNLAPKVHYDAVQAIGLHGNITVLECP